MIQATVTLTMYTVVAWLVLTQQATSDILVATINNALERTTYTSRIFPVKDFEARVFDLTPEQRTQFLDEFRKSAFNSAWNDVDPQDQDVSVVIKQNGEWMHFMSSVPEWSGKPWQLDAFKEVVTKGRVWGNFMLTEEEYIRQRVDQKQVVEFRKNIPELVHVHVNLTEMLDPEFIEQAHQKGVDFSNAHLVFIVKPISSSPFFLELLVFIGRYLLFTFLLMLPFIFFVANRVTKRARTLRSVLSDIAQGDLSARANIAGHDEMGQLADHINGMVVALEDRERLRSAVRLAGQLQRGLLPQAPPCNTKMGLEIAQSNKMSNRVGGDFFDYLCDGKVLIVIVGDISGHGLESGLMMAASRTALRIILRLEESPLTMLQRVNAQLREDLSQGHFLTLAVLRMNLETGEYWHVSAGHEPTLLKKTDGTIDQMKSTTVPLAMFRELRKMKEPIRGTLQPGEMLLLSTDGLRECFNNEGRQFGQPEILRILQNATSATELIDQLLKGVEEHRNGHPVEDDITLVAIRRPVQGEGQS